MNITHDNDSLDSFINDLTHKPQPTCNIDNPEDCEGCGS